MTATGNPFFFNDFSDFENREKMECLEKGVAVKLTLEHLEDAKNVTSDRRKWRGVLDASSPEIRLENAVLLGRWQEVRFLIEAGVDVSHCDNWILRMATLAGETTMIRFLVERGADPLDMRPSQVKQAAQVAQSALSKVGARAKLGMSPASSGHDAIERFSLSAPSYMM